ncbi:MAG: MATE family efflux transporter [Chloroflexota bacterium]|nr:MATE family efflux transporter [Chloroflexota bacterium]MDE2854897.1 MATE family efflux transporter [Chloroflexota bacterium]MDE2948130.1 MATE family efflux transporter [Chloroflexota bacterium]
MNEASPASERHPYLRRPTRTILYLSLPILLSLIAEPVTGLVDTGFVARLGAVPLAALGVGAGALSSVLWIFNFLGIATQTDVAQTFGRGDAAGASKALSLALVIGIMLSLLLSALLMASASIVATALGAEGAVHNLATTYIRARTLGAPAVMLVIVGFGALRGIQDMKTPLWIALGINLANVLLDALFIFGWGAIPALGVAGAGLASSAAQWLGALWMLWEVRRRIGFSADISLGDGVKLMRIGRDLFIRSASLTLFVLFATRVATQMGAEAGAAHQVIRQVWFFTALISESLATTAQSLVGYFVGSGRREYARRVATSTTIWSVGTGVVMLAAMLLATPIVLAAFVPVDAASVFHAAWVIAALSQPLSALAFVTDGIHWGTSDYRFLRNAMMMATACGCLGLQLIASDRAGSFAGVWLMTVLWIAIRAFWGLARLYPGVGDSPIRGGVASPGAGQK